MKNRGEMLIETIFSSLIFIIVILINVYTIRNLNKIEKNQNQKLKNMISIQNILIEIKRFNSEKIKSIVCNECVFYTSKDFKNFLGIENVEIDGSIFFDLYIDKGIAFYRINNIGEFSILEE